MEKNNADKKKKIKTPNRKKENSGDAGGRMPHIYFVCPQREKKRGKRNYKKTNSKNRNSPQNVDSNSKPGTWVGRRKKDVIKIPCDFLLPPEKVDGMMRSQAATAAFFFFLFFVFLQHLFFFSFPTIFLLQS